MHYTTDFESICGEVGAEGWQMTNASPRRSSDNCRAAKKALVAASALAVFGMVQVNSTARAAEARPFYAGKTLTIVVGLPPGGGADAYARLVQRYYARHIPGTPTIVVQNLPGAGSLKAVMYLNTTAPSDGTVLATFSSTLINEALTAPARVQADFRSYSWIGNVSEDVRVCYVWGASGVKNWQDMFAPRQKELFMGATARGRARHRRHCRHRHVAESLRSEAPAGAGLLGQRG